MAFDSTPGGTLANSFGSVAEADNYFDNERIPLSPLEWDDFDNKELNLIMATRAMVAYFTARRTLVAEPPTSQRIRNNWGAYYLINRTWTGLPATTTQALPFPRIGMYDVNGNLIPSDVVPMDLKRAQFELAGRLGTADLTLDNDIAIQGITSVKVGSVAVAFKNEVMAMTLIPQYVLTLLPASWLTDEGIEYINTAEINFL